MILNLQAVLKTDKHILRNLYSLYLHDLSMFTKNIELQNDGSFHFEELDSFWETEGFSPYFIMHEEKVIGFLLLLERPFLKKDNDFAINDIFLLNQFRGKGFGKEILEKLFMEKQGKYFVIELKENTSAVAFWKKVYKQLNIDFDEITEMIDDEPCLIQTFKV